jgi:hypothetical protein
VRLSSSGRRIEDQEVVSQFLIYFNYSSFVSASVTVVGGREDSDDLLFMTPIVALKIRNEHLHP